MKKSSDYHIRIGVEPVKETWVPGSDHQELTSSERPLLNRKPPRQAGNEEQNTEKEWRQREGEDIMVVLGSSTRDGIRHHADPAAAESATFRNATGP